MNRKEFIAKSIAAGVVGLIAPAALKTVHAKDKSDYGLLKDRIGFNHLPKKESKTMNTLLHKANTRGNANHGWLDAKHTFSFANYHNPERMHFGVLRVLNDDKIAPGMGFGTHPHDNMEIITIPLEGDLEHKDNMGNGTVIKNGDVQVMSAGNGITHSEFNANKDQDVKLLQIWLFPNKKNVEPRYDQISLNKLEKENQFYQILSPNSKDEGVWIHQNAWFSIGKFNKLIATEYKLRSGKNGVYAFVINGNVTIQDQELKQRDGFGIWNTDAISIEADKNSKILLMEVPMSI